MISKNHLTPEISLHLITSECKLFHEPVCEGTERVFDNDPFWGFYWPGGQALSRFILDTPSVVKSLRILDVGSGSGACSIAAKMSGAKIAVANDIDYGAKVAADLNAELNNVIISTCTQNLIGNFCKDFDVILVGDVFYDKDIADQILPWLTNLRKKGKEIYIGDPGRHGLSTDAMNLMDKVLTYELPENCCIENNGFKIVNVWKVK
ncbi:electron transfer flavoprotein beta subunit lysine methyltransferase-like isoform X2 [Hermetia illucens]|nr:electron transfer flavoprotein beta subunit lysine methyltransferase-like isoform X2 [Hermetia illucens]XP_037912024.1 electron transfer flavoprotein beta subunit lysine methyltransferase-like isoform X2 [Hermetia illucens]XP_037912031.1 electron transfer flavoprotein beta subunit lysine methyltransferase-like isoform X2 [Hermetia illucens]